MNVETCSIDKHCQIKWGQMMFSYRKHVALDVSGNTRFLTSGYALCLFAYGCRLSDTVYLFISLYMNKHNKIGNVRINVILRRVRVIIYAVEKQCHTLRASVCSLSYAACKALAPYLYCHLWPLRLHQFFSH